MPYAYIFILIGFVKYLDLTGDVKGTFRLYALMTLLFSPVCWIIWPKDFVRMAVGVLLHIPLAGIYFWMLHRFYSGILWWVVFIFGFLIVFVLA